jgi:hypothetical protein
MGSPELTGKHVPYLHPPVAEVRFDVPPLFDAAAASPLSTAHKDSGRAFTITPYLTLFLPLCLRGTSSLCCRMVC